MATIAIHQMGDISRETPQLCIVTEEDEENYYGNWLTGFGYINVRYPKNTTRDLTVEEIEKHHGKILTMNGKIFSVVNLKNENFQKKVVLTRERDNKTVKGTLVAPIKIGSGIVLLRDDGKTYVTSAVKSISDDVILTKNSVYCIQYKD